MSESQAIQSIMNAELEVYRQKGRVLELEADNSALRADLERHKAMLKGCIDDICQFEKEMEERHGMEFTDDYGGRWQGDVVTGHINALRQHIKQLESNAANLVDRNKALRTECVEAQQERDALRLKVQELEAWYEANEALQPKRGWRNESS